jgi:ATP-binding protein involved in chromosome partitioning
MNWRGHPLESHQVIVGADWGDHHAGGLAGPRLLGGVENFATLACPHCGQPVEVFPQVPQPRSIWAAGAALLGRVPVDPLVAAAGDSGRPLLVDHRASPSAAALREIASRVLAALEEGAGP